MKDAGSIRKLLTDFHEVPSLTAALRFEELVFSVLDAEIAERGGRQLSRSPAGFAGGLDGVLLDGIASLAGPVRLMIKYFSPHSGSAKSRISTAVDQLSELWSSGSTGTFLLVHNLEMDADLRNWTQDLISRRPGRMDIVVWGAEDLERIATGHPMLVGVLTSTLTRRSLERTLASQKSSWREASLGNLRELRRLCDDEGLSVFLGAGVSSGSGLPSWQALIASLFSAAMKDHVSDLAPTEVESLVSAVSQLNSNSPLQTARYLRSVIDDPTSFSAGLSAALYGDYEPDNVAELLDAVSMLCKSEGNAPRVHSVITYNFDDLLEERLREDNVSFGSIYHGSHVPSARQLSVYHVHGFLPRNHAAYERLDESLIAFSEEGYHRLYSEPYHWTNVVQLNALREHTCLFLGLSMGDPNLRRLLELGVRGAEEPRHFAFIKRTEVHEIKKERLELEHMSAERVRDFLEMHHAVQENVMKELGINVIWFERFEEMPREVRGIARPR